MGSMGERAIGYWKQACTLMSMAASVVLAFSKLLDVPIVLRLGLVAACGGIFTAFIVASIPVRDRLAGFSGPSTRPRFYWSVVLVKIMLVLIVSAGVVGLLLWTLTFHDIRLSQATNERDARSGTINLVPSHFATDVSVFLSTPQPDVQILSLSPQDCGKAHIGHPNIQDQTEFSATLHLYEFKTPQQLCMLYRLSDRADRLQAIAIPRASNMDVVSDSEMESYQVKFIIFGVILCALDLLWLSFRYSWYHWPPS